VGGCAVFPAYPNILLIAMYYLSIDLLQIHSHFISLSPTPNSPGIVLIFSRAVNRMLVASCTAETAGQVQTRQGGMGLVVVVDMVDDSVVFEACLVVVLLQGHDRERHVEKLLFMRDT
jgi:hypothetical protein